MENKFTLSLDDEERVAAIGRALSVPVRIEILRLLCKEELNVQEIAARTGLAVSSAASHVKALEEGKLIDTELRPAVRGSMKVCKRGVAEIALNFITTDDKKKEKVISMPVGYYTDYKVQPTCGLAGEYGPIGTEDEPKSYFHPERANSQIIWFGKTGYVEYRFPIDYLDGTEKRIEISAEVCSEAPDYKLDYPSDITLWLNGKEVGTFTCPGDFGGRRGRLNPNWWPDKNTQFGLKKCWKITNKGSYIDNKKVSKLGLKDYKLKKQDYLTVRIGVKADAKNAGGVNIFGEKFGDYPQSIELKVCF